MAATAAEEHECNCDMAEKRREGGYFAHGAVLCAQKRLSHDARVNSTASQEGFPPSTPHFPSTLTHTLLITKR